ncbi:MAG: hypothetical protein J07HX64_00763 [halophilic archaeon J07HX64]|jgi:hypothetical protein|nr:MAG: hypothetical protein J07HX64_00763 [halophilic archaeon J07HX64]
MGESAPLRSRLRTDLTGSQSVTATAVGLGLVVFVLVSLDNTPLPVPAEFRAEFLLSLSLMDTAFTYNEFWPVEHSPAYAALWALVSGLLTAGVFVGVYELVGLQAGTTVAGVGAFLGAVGLQLGTAILYARIR